MYTSGWPKSQNMCCHNKGDAPAAGLKKLASKMRSNISWKSATAMIGIAKMIRNDVTSDIQTNSGIRNSDMPGARMFRIVTMKLKPPAIEAMPRIYNPSIQ